MIASIKANIIVGLSGYFTDIEIGHIRFYRQEFGSTKKHVDVSIDGKSNYTLLVYLSDDFEGGGLELKHRRTQQEIDSEPNYKDKKHAHYVINPREGYGIII